MIYCTVGTTSCGKSTWARQTKMPVISDDTLREMIYGKYQYIKEDEWWIKAIAVEMALSIEDIKGDCIIDSAVWFLNNKDRLFGVDIPQIKWVVFPIIGTGQVRKARTEDNRGIPIDKWIEIFYEHLELIDFVGLNEKNSFKVDTNELS